VQLDGTIRGRVESKLIEPYKGAFDYSATSLVANAVMHHVSAINALHYILHAVQYRALFTFYSMIPRPLEPWSVQPFSINSRVHGVH